VLRESGKIEVGTESEATSDAAPAAPSGKK